MIVTYTVEGKTIFRSTTYDDGALEKTEDGVRLVEPGEPTFEIISLTEALRDPEFAKQHPEALR